MFSLGGFLNSILGIGDSIADWLTFVFSGDSVAAVLSYLRVFISYMPNVLSGLSIAAFGGMIVIALFRGIGR